MPTCPIDMIVINSKITDVRNVYFLFFLKSAYKDGWFEGTWLISLLRDTITLPQGHETDLLHGMDR